MADHRAERLAQVEAYFAAEGIIALPAGSVVHFCGIPVELTSGTIVKSANREQIAAILAPEGK